jgi:hypothetical protein
MVELQAQDLQLYLPLQLPINFYLNYDVQQNPHLNKDDLAGVKDVEDQVVA